jgi:hypothetical protein
MIVYCRKVSPLSGDLQDWEVLTTSLDDFDSGFSVDKLVEGELFKERLYTLLEQSEPELHELVYAIFEFHVFTPRENRRDRPYDPCRYPKSEKAASTFSRQAQFVQPVRRK